MNRRELLSRAVCSLLPTAVTTGCARDNRFQFHLSRLEQVDAYEPIRAPIEAELQTKIVFRREKTNAKWVNAFQSGTADAGESLALIAASSFARSEVDIVLDREHPTLGYDYRCAMITREDSEINSLADLRNRRIALGFKFNLPMTIYPLKMLRDAGLAIGGLPEGDGSDADFHAHKVDEPSRYGREIRELVLGDNFVEAGGLAEPLVRNEDGTVMDGLTILDSEGGIPTPPIVVRADLKAVERESLTEGFLKARDETFSDVWFRDVRRTEPTRYTENVIRPIREVGVNPRDIAKFEIPESWVKNGGRATPTDCPGSVDLYEYKDCLPPGIDTTSSDGVSLSDTVNTTESTLDRRAVR